MAQVLKEEQRIKIMQAAKKEFRLKGIPLSSMRSIAQNANMTVGNLYHYYKNKDEMTKAVIGPALQGLNLVMAKVIGNNRYYQTGLVNFGENQIKEILTSLADALVEMESKYGEELYIIMRDEKIRNIYKEQLFLLLKEILLKTKELQIKEGLNVDFLSKMFASSIVAGLEEGIKIKLNSQMSKEEFRNTLRAYMLQIMALLKE